ncbi:MAG: acyltransferase, partial [Chitinophagaceae bacterium]|nr:acyltransferase [Chitinophagaceae bacterium]
MYTQKNNQLLLIQVLRGIASFMVVLFHATENFRLNFDSEFLSGFFSFGAAGVDLFFVLSGFIITYTSGSLVGRPSNVSYFLKRRVIRIFPIYWIIAAAFLCVQLALPSFYKNGYSFTGFNLLGTFLLLPGHSMVNGVSWTLTNELFFYILFIAAFLIRNRALLYSLATGYCLLLIGVFFSGQFMSLSD